MESWAEESFCALNPRVLSSDHDSGHSPRAL